MAFVSNHIKYLVMQFLQILSRQEKLNRVACFPFCKSFLAQMFLPYVAVSLGESPLEHLYYIKSRKICQGVLEIIFQRTAGKF